MITETRLTRFKDASWLGEKEPCIVGGAGGISSWLTLMLARANFMPVVYDFDTLEEHNLGGQLFPFSGIGKPKVEVLAQVVKDFTGMEINILNERYTQHSMTGMFVFSGFDNIKSREIMLYNWVENLSKADKSSRANYIFIDGRLLAEQMQIFCITGDNVGDIAKYRTNFIFPDEEAVEGPCTMKQTSHAAAMIASFMMGYFTNHIHNIRSQSKTRFIPFQHEYFIPLDLFT